MPTSRPLLSTENLSVSIGGQRIVTGLEMELLPGQSLGVLGPNGIGKTTLLLTLAGVRRGESGRVLLDGRPIPRIPRREIARRLGMLTQNTRFAFDATCLQVALAGRHPFIGGWGRERSEDIQKALASLRMLGLEPLAQRSCETLSGGEQRRLALATVMTQDPDVLLADEPTNHLDPAHQVEVLDHLWARLQANERRRGQVMAIHDINLATCYCTHILMLSGDGAWALGECAEMLTEKRLSRLFGCPIRAVHDARQTVFAVAGGAG